MKFFPIKVAIICLLATPLLYNITLISSEKILNKSYSNQIENILIGDSKLLLNGSIRLEEQIANNIQEYLIQDFLVQKIRLKLNIIVTNDQGKIIYPIFLDLNSYTNELDNNLNTDAISKNNFELLNNGLHVNTQVQLGHGSLAANIILILYFGVALLVFLIFYKIGISKAELAQKKDKKLLSELQKEEQVHKQILDELKKERQGLFENIKALNARYQEDTRKAKLNEEEMFDEIISLEEQINSYIDLKRAKENEIENLKTKIQKYERRKSSKGRRNEFDFVLKRFKALYKNVSMNRKALSGFLSLNEDQQIKAEELIVMLDRKPDNVTIKRKVFSGKKHKTTCFEVLFAYNGRLYFKKNENNSIEVLVIGTKNTQTKDMDFIHKL